MKLAILSLSLGPLIRSENKKLQRSQGLSRENSFSPLNLPSLPFFPAFQMDRPTPGHCRSLLSYRRGVSPSGTENPAEMQSFLLPFPLFFPFQHSWESGLFTEIIAEYSSLQRAVSPTFPGNHAKLPCLHLSLQHND